MTADYGSMWILKWRLEAKTAAERAVIDLVWKYYREFKMNGH